MEVEGVRPRGRPTLGDMDTIRRDIKKRTVLDMEVEGARPR